MSEVVEASGPKVPPSYPPKSPPPQKKPVEPPRPQPATKPKSLTGVPPRLVVTSRRARVLAFRADQWAARKAAAQAALAVAEWDYPLLDEHDFLKAVHGLVHAAVAACGKRVSVHLADQDAKVLVMVLNHQIDEQDAVSQVPAEVAVLRTVEACGSHTDHDGHAWWALLDAEPRPKSAWPSTTQGGCCRPGRCPATYDGCRSCPRPTAPRGPAAARPRADPGGGYCTAVPGEDHR